MTQRFSFLALTICASLLAGCALDSATKSSNVQGAASVSSGESFTSKQTPNFSSTTAGFAIWFPAKPTQKRIAGSSEWGKYETFVFQSETTPVTYLVIATTIPFRVDTSDQRVFLNSAQKGMLETSHATVERSRDFTLNGTAGHELYTDILKGKAKSRVFLCMTPKVSYQVSAVGLTKEFPSQKAQIEKVLSSFRLAGKP